jgi:glycosyltransferase involved in cell wall biosynthesis
VSRPRIGFVTERMLLGFGVDLVIHRTALGLAERGYEVTVFPSISDGTFENDRYRIVPLLTPASRVFPRYEANALRRLPLLRAQPVDLYFIETFPYFALAPFLRQPVVAVEYGVCSTLGFPLWLKADFLYMRLTQEWLYFPWARRIVAISDYLRRRLPVFLRRRTAVVPPGIDHYDAPGDPAAARARVRARFGVGEDEVLLLYVGRINPRLQPYKGTAPLLACYRRLREAGLPVRLLAVGFGSAEDEAWVAGQGGDCWLSAPAAEMGAIYAAADVYATGSVWEGFDMPLVEAQRAGRPAVALRIGAHPEVARDGETAFLVDGMTAFEGAVRRLVEDRGLRARMGARAREWAGRFTWAAAVDAYDRLIGETLAAPGRRAEGPAA